MSQQPRPDALESGSSEPGDHIRVDTRLFGDHLVLVVCGEADIDTAETLREELTRALTPTTRSVAVDASRLRFCDLAGLDALDGFCADAATRHMTTAVHGMSPLLTWLREVFVPLSWPTWEVAATDT